jgi:molybdate-binding protein/DNA-binding transcriptional regulator YhcF (GntR family)
MDIKLDSNSSTPLYQQIAAKLRQLIATEQVKPGDRLPSIRQLSQTLNVNPNTVCRAYLELEQEQILTSRRGGGTTVNSRGESPAIKVTRQKKLLDNVNEDIVNTLSQGYSPEELESAFYLSLARWREERKTVADEAAGTPVSVKNSNVMRIVGSHDLALNILLDLLRHREEGLQIEVTHSGSLAGLIAIQEGRADLAGAHLLDEETGEYNYPFIKKILPGSELAIVNLAYRIQGLMYAPGNPHQIHGLDDLQRQDIVFVNRQKGSGTRVLLDLQMKQRGIATSGIKGYGVELSTHMAVAAHITHGKADVGLGIEAAAKSCNLGFLPLFRERYDLVIPMTNYRSKRLGIMLEIIVSDEFKKIVEGIGGYDTSQTGNTTFLS